MTRTSCFGTAKCIIFNIYLGRKEIVLIFFRHFVERPATIFTCSTIIGLRLRHQQRLRETQTNDKMNGRLMPSRTIVHRKVLSYINVISI